MSIVKVLELSTAHLSRDTRALLRDQSPEILNQLAVYDSEYGWFIPTVVGSTDGLPADLAECIAYANEHDCLWLHFDCDEEICGDLPQYSDQ